MIPSPVTRDRARQAALGCAAILFFASVVTGCGSSTPTASPTSKPSPAASVTATASPTASSTAKSSASASASASGSASASPSGSASAGPSDNTPSVGLHYDETLEALLPSQIGGMQPDKISVPLSSYLSSASGQDKALYQAWLAKLGKKPENAAIAAAVAGTDTVKFTLLALQADGVTQDASFAAIRDALTTQKWQYVDKLIATKIVTEATDPDTGTVGDVYVKNGIVYVIMTSDSSLLTEALIRLP